LLEVSVQATRDEFELHPARCEACEAAKAEALAQEEKP
jgi:hypothetical protein